MARQKPDVSLVKHIVEPPVSKEAEELENASPEECESDDSSESALDEETKKLGPETLLARGTVALKESRWDDAIRLLECALTKRAGELDEDELHPRLAEYWMRYGDALFTRDECTEELFALETPSKDDNNSNKEIAYESLDAARLCYERRLAEHVKAGRLTSHDEGLTAPTEACDDGVTQPSRSMWTPKACSEDTKIVQDVNDAIFVRVRLGDFHQAFHEYEKAIEEFEAALDLCRRFTMPFSAALTPAIPLAHCYLALDSELTEKAFDLCVTLIDLELEDSDGPTAQRKEVLISTQHDLKLQVKEYLHDRNRLIEEAKNAVRDVWKSIPEKDESSPTTATAPVEEAVGNEEPLDLGVVGKKRSRKQSNIP